MRYFILHMQLMFKTAENSSVCVSVCVCEGEREGDTNRVIYLVMAAVLAVNGSSQPSDLQGTAQCKKHYASYMS